VRRLVVVVALAACSGSQAGKVGSLRFTNADPVTLVNDRKPTELPSTFDTGLVEYYMREDVAKPIEHVLTIDPLVRARNVNSLGEVPDSAWFTNRRPTPAQVHRGPGGDGPDRSEPWRVVGVKVGGAAIGFTIEDARHDSYLLKFDDRGFPETETSADVIVQRLTWAFGYNVPENNIVTFAREELVLDPKAVVKYRTGKKRPMTEADLEQYLSLVESDHGHYRGLVSKMIPGKVLGGVEPEGTRKGDTNDVVPHQLRRDLRGQRILWAWVNHIDVKSQNTLAAYTDDEYVKWYALDFGESLGVAARTTNDMRLGYRTTYSLRSFLTSLVTFGLRVEPWERPATVPSLRGLGDFESQQFDPAQWQPNHNWRPTDAADRFDELWAAMILMRLSRAHVEAAVAAGGYTDPRTAAYVTRTLLERQRKLGRYAFSRVAPLDRIEARERGTDVEVCFDDLWLFYRYGVAAGSSYRARSFDVRGAQLGIRPWLKTRGTGACVTAPAARGADGYTIVGIEVRRGDDAMPPVFVHVARGPAGARVIGVDRR
jgi:hypothetical protein